MWEWIVIGALYGLGIGSFSLLGGFRAAGEALERWGRASAAARAKRLTPSS